jgi:hypothetical protein
LKNWVLIVLIQKYTVFLRIPIQVIHEQIPVVVARHEGRRDGLVEPKARDFIGLDVYVPKKSFWFANIPKYNAVLRSGANDRPAAAGRDTAASRAVVNVACGGKCADWI